MGTGGDADSFDYVIVGSGMAGSVLAARLSEDGRHSVCVLEAGPPDRSPYIHLPAGFIKLLFNPKYTWQFKTEPGPGIDGRQVATTQGRTLGGSSSINGFNYNRGQRGDFDTWAQMGNRGWGYADVLPYFRRSERRLGDADPRFRGSDGPLPITDCDWQHPLCEAFLEGAAELGIPRNPDYNGVAQAGTGYYQRWIHRGRRVSAARAFLHPAARRHNLEVRTNAQATQIVFENRRATGVSYAAGPGEPPRMVRARREVVLACGSANTPKLLQISGIGPGPLLRELEVPVVHALPGVGENLRDHYMVRLVGRVQGVRTLNSMVRGPRLAGEVAKWLLGRPSALAISPSVAYGFWQSDEALSEPDLQLVFTPGSYKASIPGLLDAFEGMTLGFYQQRPESLGHVRARSRSAFDDPAIQPNYLMHETDRRVALGGIRLARRLLHAPALQRYLEREEQPGEAATSDDALLDFARAQGSTAYHLIGTCRMGPADRIDSVVDDELRVIGVEGLRVADASIMPTMPSANTGAATLMIGEKAADLILGRTPLPAEALETAA
ncbi:MAG TPA: GMC family oxidoreductase N-terminal domain-containing protein [Alphaproteobacteria bacterium]|nr:GMC family oxidoreductase N-terminal domain-containing protein [Alphaproteobacteria bacterium]